jgi:hypothetical protein
MTTKLSVTLCKTCGFLIFPPFYNSTTRPSNARAAAANVGASAIPLCAPENGGLSPLLCPEPDPGEGSEVGGGKSPPLRTELASLGTAISVGSEPDLRLESVVVKPPRSKLSPAVILRLVSVAIGAVKVGVGVTAVSPYVQ